MQWHEHAQRYPLLEGEEYDKMRDSAKHGGIHVPIVYRMVDGTKQGLDGRNRERIAKELKIPLPEQHVELTDSEVPGFIDALNLYRRHLSREQRQAVVGRLHAAGNSGRKIADTLGVSEGTVRSDLKSGAQNCAPDQKPAPNTGNSQKVTGKDGKLYDAKRSAFCPRCQRTGPVKNCKACAELRHPRREPGVEDEAGDKKRERAARKNNGRPLYVEKDFEAHFGALVRWHDKRALALHYEKNAVTKAIRKDLQSLLDHITEARKLFR